MPSSVKNGCQGVACCFRSIVGGYQGDTGGSGSLWVVSSVLQLGLGHCEWLPGYCMWFPGHSGRLPGRFRWFWVIMSGCQSVAGGFRGIVGDCQGDAGGSGSLWLVARVLQVVLGHSKWLPGCCRWFPGIAGGCQGAAAGSGSLWVVARVLQVVTREIMGGYQSAIKLSLCHGFQLHWVSHLWGYSQRVF